MGLRAWGVAPESRTSMEGESFRSGLHACFNVSTAAGTSAYNWQNDRAHAFLVTRVYGYMTGAGAAADTVVVQRVKAASTDSITDTVDVSALSDTDAWDAAQINDAYNIIYPGDVLQVTTASDALSRVFIEGFWQD